MIPCILAHDLGTSGNKASLFDFNGKLIGSTVVSYSVYYPRRGWAEERPEDWWNAVCQATKSVLEMVPDAEVSTVAYTISGLVVDVVFIIIYVLMMKFVFRADMSKMANIDAGKLSSEGDNKVTKKQLVLVISFIIAALYSFVVALLPAGAAITIFLSRFGGSLWFCMIVAILCIVQYILVI